MDTDQPRPSSSPHATTRGEPVRQFSVFLQTRAGALLGVVKLVHDSLAEVIGISVKDSIDGTVVRLVTTAPETVETLFIEKGIPFSSVELVVVELGGADDLGRCLGALLRAETNIHFCYPLLSRPGGNPLLALCLEDSDFGSSVLSSNGFKLLQQNDLSR